MIDKENAISTSLLYDRKSSSRTNLGPNEEDTSRHSIVNKDNLSATDLLLKIKDRVVDVKELEAVKKKLPKGVTIRITGDGIIRFRARFRKKGYPQQIQTFPELKLAKHWLDEQNRNALLNIHMPGLAAKKTLLSEAIDLYIQTILPHKPKNAINTRRHLEWWKKELGKYAIAAIRPRLIQEKCEKLRSETGVQGKKRSNSTVVRYLASLSHLFTIAQKEWDYVSENPIRNISKPPENPPRERYLTKEECGRVQAACQESRCPVLFTIFTIALTTGMRYSEILNLRKSDVDLFEEVIKLKTSKNGRPRHIPLKGTALNLTAKIHGLTNGSELLFPAPHDPCKPYDIRTAWDAAVKRAEIKDFHFHDIRHSTASHLIMQGKGIHDVAELLGHKDLQSTKRYSHLSNEYKSKIVEDLDEHFFGSS